MKKRRIFVIEQSGHDEWFQRQGALISACLLLQGAGILPPPFH